MNACKQGKKMSAGNENEAAPFLFDQGTNSIVVGQYII
jgi:hypothetical protein